MSGTTEAFSRVRLTPCRGLPARTLLAMNVITGKLKATAEKARQILDRILIPLWRVNPTQTLYQRGLDLQARFRLSFYDSLIVAAA